MAGRLLLSPRPGAWVIVAVLLAAAVSSCERAPKQEPAGARLGDPHADGKRLALAASSWAKRWEQTGEPPPCALLLEGTNGAVCDSARSALAELRKARTGSGEAAVLRHTATLAVTAHRATEALRRSGLEALAGERKARPAPSASATGAPARAPSATPSALASAAHQTERVHDNPHAFAITAYSRLSKLALRELAGYLELGPLTTRRRAFTELARIAREEPRWAGVRDIVNEAALIEPDAELERELRALGRELAAR